MKKLLIGLTLLASISSFARTVEEGGFVFNKTYENDSTYQIEVHAIGGLSPKLCKDQREEILAQLKDANKIITAKSECKHIQYELEGGGTVQGSQANITYMKD